MSSPNQSQIPTQFRAISRHNSNTSTASSSNKGDLSSTISTVNSTTSSRNHLSKRQLIDPRQILASCSSSTPIRSFQRATLSSVAKTRAFDNNPVLQSLLAAVPSSHNSVSNSQTSSPLPTPIFSRSRSLRMSGGSHRYQNSPNHYRASSRTPDLFSYNSGDNSSCFNDSQSKLTELSNEKTELKESLEFLECERQVLIDTSKELKETLSKERSQWKKELDELKRQLTDTIAARIKAESQLTRNEMEMNDLRNRLKKMAEEQIDKEKQNMALRKNIETINEGHQELIDINNELKKMLTERLKYNGFIGSSADFEDKSQMHTDCASIVTELAKLRLELNEKEKLIEKFSRFNSQDDSDVRITPPSYEIDTLNKFLDDTVECIKSWPEELAGSSYVQNLMKTLLKTYKPEQDSMSIRIENLHLKQ